MYNKTELGILILALRFYLKNDGALGIQKEVQLLLDKVQGEFLK